MQFTRADWHQLMTVFILCQVSSSDFKSAENMSGVEDLSEVVAALKEFFCYYMQVNLLSY